LAGRVVLVVETPRVGPGGSVAFRVCNLAGSPVYTGLDYRVERLTPNGWAPCRRLTPDLAAMVLLRIDPGACRSFQLPVRPGTPPGLYRVVKRLAAGPGAGGWVELAGEFTVEP
jgi:hypothetical protein